MNDFISYVTRNGVKYDTVIVGGGVEYITPNGQGKCRSDNGNRMIYFEQQRNDWPRGSFKYNGDNRYNTYETCKNFALQMRATVFGLQYGGECHVGTSNDVALGRRNTPQGMGTPFYRGFYWERWLWWWRLWWSGEESSDACGGNFGRGGGWSQNVYEIKYKPSSTTYKLNYTDLDNFLRKVHDQGYTDVSTMLNAFITDSTMY